jgi:hypothetical protein
VGSAPELIDLSVPRVRRRSPEESEKGKESRKGSETPPTSMSSSAYTGEILGDDRQHHHHHHDDPEGTGTDQTSLYSVSMDSHHHEPESAEKLAKIQQEQPKKSAELQGK